jgi:hypothetical protein
MLRKQKKRKRKNLALSLMRDLQGSAATKLAIFEKMRAAGGFANEDPADVAEAERMPDPGKCSSCENSFGPSR